MRNLFVVILVVLVVVVGLKMMNRHESTTTPGNDLRQSANQAADNIKEGAKDVRRDLEDAAD